MRDLSKKSLTRYSSIAFFGVAMVGLCAFSVKQFPVVTPAALGTPALCQSYAGLPKHWRDEAHAGMVYVNGGEFTLGTLLGYEEERGEVQSKVDGFWIDQTEVTVAQFADFVKATGYVTEAERDGGAVTFHTPTREQLDNHAYPWWRYQKGANWRQPAGEGSAAQANHPVTMVTLNDALAYAHWLGRDLPSEEQWEYAAKTGQHGVLEKEPRNELGKPQANFWQGDFPLINSKEDGYEGVAPVGCFPANAATLYDMIGNVWEQTKDIYSSSHQPLPASTNAFSATADTAMVVKGGSHLCGQNFCVRYRPSAREAHEANLPIAHIGFRTVLRDNQPLALNQFNPW